MVNFVVSGNGTWKYSNPLFKTPLPSPDNLSKPISRSGMVAANKEIQHMMDSTTDSRGAT